MIVVSTDKGNLSFQSVDDVLKFVQTSVQENIELWISGKQPYPCISVCISGEYAAINYFQNDTGDMWLSYNEENQEDVTFMAAGEEWEPDVNAVISINSAFSCIREFCATYERPCCIQWQELQLPVFETEKSEVGKGCTAMLRKLNCFFNIVIGSFIGVFIGFGIYKFWHFKTYPNLYVMQSAPWYTELLLDGAMVAVVVVVCIVLKLVIWRKLKP